MLVSSLVTQSQLYEVRDIASGRSKSHVFDTLQDLNVWMNIPDNVATLVIGDNLYLIDSQVSDYWWDGTLLRELETQLPDLTNVVTALGTATGGAGGGVRTIADIQSNSYSKSESDSKYVDLITQQTIGDNKIFSLEVRSPTFKLPGYNSDNAVMSGAMKNKSHFVLTDEVDQTVAGTKTFAENFTTNGFIKFGGTNQEILLVNRTVKPLSEFASESVDLKLLLANGGTMAKSLIVQTTGSQTIAGQKTLTENITAFGFVKYGGTNQQVVMQQIVEELMMIG
ncbi:MAG: hypothetical protein EZS28_013622 [Streblomastix strix]|uniref:Uncharacterized protein n=1 Tax=Streblomastix strix TaxID=222440 RepID=A0A5J4W7P7_9EUKA|nr:MAG: hypothetical protein EZS28_013622 [Streblomastix strix]